MLAARSPGTLALALFAAGIASASGAALAQGGVLPTGEPSAYRFYTSHDGTYLMIDDASVVDELGGNVGLVLDYAHRPFALDDIEYNTFSPAHPVPTGTELDLNGGTFVGQLHGSVSLFSRVRIGLSLPIVLYTFGQGYSWSVIVGGVPRSQNLPAGSGGGLGDPRLHALVEILDPAETGFFGLAVAAWVTAPFGQLTLARRYVGEPGVSLGGHLIFSVRVEGFRAALNLGGSWREEARIIQSGRTAELTWGLGARYDFDATWGVLAELAMQTTFGTVFDDEAPTEVRVAAVARLGDVQIDAGLGFGIAYAIGVPVVRALVGVSWAPHGTPDSDHDGVDDTADGCPGEPEDLDGNADQDGCPDEDDDEDGIPDATDACVGEAEDVDGNADEDGCPDEDDDGDGVRDGYDSCPQEAEDVDGDRDADGCPDDDADRDHIPDGTDQCPGEPEDTDGLGDEDGCPEDDFDGDGVADVDDECAEQAEDDDGYQDADGCPDEGRGSTRRRPR